MRALAVSAVLAYHLWPTRLPGGYVGVDVFFVISGFLITGQLVAEVERTGRVRLARFWARRARRLVPASSIVLLGTAIGVVLFAPLALWRQFLGEVIASALQVENWRLAHDAVDYLASDNERSPVQHFWSLSVEEQFYVAVPLLLILVTLATQRRAAIRLPVVLLLLGAASLLSFAWSVHETRTSPGVAYFSTLTRAWEFGAGALLASGRSHRRPVTRTQLRRVPSAGATLGVGAIAIACLTYSDTTAFPGWHALLPVGGAALVLASGPASVVGAVGRWAPVALLGRSSYAVYLWHLPLIVLLPYVTGHPLGPRDKLAVLLATGFLAVASTFLVEEPVRFHPRLLAGRRPLVVGSWSLLAIALVVSTAAMARHHEAERASRLAASAAQILTGDTRCLGAQAVCRVPGLMEALIPRKDESHGSTEEVPRGASGAGDSDGGRSAA